MEKKKVLLIDIFEANAKRLKEKIFLRYEDQSFTYTQAQKKSNQLANMALDMEINRGDTVALMMFNEPLFIWFMLGKIFISIFIYDRLCGIFPNYVSCVYKRLNC